MATKKLQLLGANLAPTGILRSGEGENSVVQIQPDAVEKPAAQPTATGESCIALGRYNKVSGKNAMAVNYDNSVSATRGFAANHKNVIGESANNSFACCDTNTVDAPSAFAAGRLNRINANASRGFAAGLQNIVNVSEGAIFGRFGELTEGLFAIGNGHGTDSRKNIFEVFGDGSIALNGDKFTPVELRNAINTIGDIETALDGIISIQESLIGGASA